jgi:hypothetical protein
MSELMSADTQAGVLGDRQIGKDLGPVRDVPAGLEDPLV